MTSEPNELIILQDFPFLPLQQEWIGVFPSAPTSLQGAILLLDPYLAFIKNMNCICWQFCQSQHTRCRHTVSSLSGATQHQNSRNNNSFHLSRELALANHDRTNLRLSKVHEQSLRASLGSFLLSLWWWLRAPAIAGMS